MFRSLDEILYIVACMCIATLYTHNMYYKVKCQCLGVNNKYDEQFGPIHGSVSSSHNPIDHSEFS